MGRHTDMNTKKADLYFISDNKEIRISVNISDARNFDEALKAISYAIRSHNMESMRLQSIYFSEETAR